MISCAQVRPILSLFLAKETGPLETLQARRHLDDCDGCRSRAWRLEHASHRSPGAACAESSTVGDVAAGVMRRLREMKSGGTDASLFAASKWTGLVLILGAAMAGTTAPGAPLHGVAQAIARPFAFLVSLFTDGDATETVKDLAGSAAPLALKVLDGSLRTDLSARSGIDVVILLQVLATALVIGFTVIIPVAALTAWFLHRDAASGGLGHP